MTTPFPLPLIGQQLSKNAAQAITGNRTDAEAAATVAASAVGGTPLQNAGRVLGALGSPGLWKRVGLMALGGWLMWIGILVIISQTQAGKDAAAAVVGIASKGVVK